MPEPLDPEMPTYVQWDVRNWSRALSFWLQVIGPAGIEGAEVLELGSRDGGLSLWLARQGARHVVCSDLDGPADTARELHHDSGVSDRIEYASIDATQIGRPEAFDIIVFKSVLGGIGGVGGLEAQAQAIRSIHESLRPGGRLLFAENLTASPLHASLRRRFVRWSEHWRYVDAAEVDALLEPFSSVRTTTLGFVGAFGRSETPAKRPGPPGHRRARSRRPEILALHRGRSRHQVAAWRSSAAQRRDRPGAVTDPQRRTTLASVRRITTRSPVNVRDSTYSRYSRVFFGSSTLR